MTEEKNRNMIKHHIAYIETHGYDKTILISRSDHKKIDHRKLFPNYTVEEIRKFSERAPARCPGYQESRKNYNQNYAQTETGKKSKLRYQKKNIRQKSFSLPVGKNVLLRQFIRYNMSTGHIGYKSNFMPRAGKKILVRDIE